MALGQGDSSLGTLCSVHERRGVFLVERVHEAHEQEGRADVDDLIVSEHEGFVRTVFKPHVSSQTDAQIPDPVLH